MTRVAVIDDHFVVRIGIKAIIDMQDDMEFAGDAANAADIVDFVRSNAVDVLLLDIRMPGQGGIDALSRLLAAMPDAKVVMLTTSEADNDVYRSLEAGAKGYLLKDRNARDIVRAVRTVAEGGAFIPDAVRELYRERKMLPELTGRESLVLAAIAEGLGNDDIAARLGITPQAVKYHVGNLLGKFGLESRVQLSNEARRRGFV